MLTTLSRQPTRPPTSSDIRSLARWPDSPPAVEPFMHGWFAGHDLLPQFCGPGTRLIVELGSWLGMSARWFCKRCPEATVVCVDHWEGSPEFRNTWDWLVPKSHDLFLCNMWEQRNRVVPLRMDSVAGVRLLQEHDARPDLVYIDAGHESEAVAADVAACLEAFPNAQLVGDDWNWKSVQHGVLSVITDIEHSGRFWWSK